MKIFLERNFLRCPKALYFVALGLSFALHAATPEEKPATPSATPPNQPAITYLGGSSDGAQPEVKKFQGLSELLKMRDPFAPPGPLTDLEPDKSEIEKTPVIQFTMVGVMAGPRHARAILKSDKTQKIFLVSEGSKIGPHNGYIRKILDDKVIINENTTDLLGEKEVITTEIKLAPVKSARGIISDFKTTAFPGAHSQAPGTTFDINGQPMVSPQQMNGVQPGTQLMNQPASGNTLGTSGALSPTQELIKQAQALMAPGGVTGFTSAGSPALAPQATAPAIPQGNSQVSAQPGNPADSLSLPPAPDQNGAAVNSGVAPAGAGAVK